MSLSIGWELPELPAAMDCPETWVQIAQAVEYAGLDALLMPSGPQYPESFTLAAMLCAHTVKLQLIASLSNLVILPAALAEAARSLQSLSNGRLHLHLPHSAQDSVGTPSAERQQTERFAEYLHILTRMLATDAAYLNFFGHYYQVENACSPRPNIPAPPLLLDNNLSPELLAKYASHCLLPAQHPRRLSAAIARLRTAATQQSRKIRFSTRLQLISHKDAAHAWGQASLCLHRQHPTLTKEHSPMLSFAKNETQRFELYPNICQWHPDQPPLLIGSFEQVVSRLEELHALGIDQVIFSAWPAVGEVLRLGEEILPRLRARGISTEGPLVC